jgi:hypothetical protein
MVKISCPKCEAKKKFTFFLMGRGNVPGVNTNLSPPTSSLSYERSMGRDHQMVPSGTEQSEHLIKDRF